MISLGSATETETEEGAAIISESLSGFNSSTSDISFEIIFDAADGYKSLDDAN